MNHAIYKQDYFKDKLCHICHRPAKLFRFYRDKKYLLCDRDECLRVWQDRKHITVPII